MADASRTFRAITLKGRGDAVPRFSIPEGSVAIAMITHQGSDGNFCVWTIDSHGNLTDLLANVIGSYQGTRLFDKSDHSVAFKVEADGNWTIVVSPLEAAYRWDGTGTLKRRGSDVIVLPTPTGGLTSAKITHQGSENFTVFGYSGTGGDLLVNEIGRYRGEVLLAEGTSVLELEADGPWTIALRR